MSVLDLNIPGLNIVTPDQPLPPRRLFAVIYGDPGAGKTSLSFTAAAPLHFDFDKGVARAAVRGTSLQFDNIYDDKKRLTKTGFEACLELVNDNEKFQQLIEHFDLKTIILDTGGTLLDNSIMPYVFAKYPKYRQADGAATLKGYGALKSVFKTFLQNLQQNDLDVVMICHAQEKDERMQPKMTGSSLDIIKEMADMLGYLKMEGTQRIVDFRPTDAHFGKNTAEIPPMTIPHFQDEEYDGFLQRIIDLTRHKMSSLSKEQKKAVAEADKAFEKLNEDSSLDEIAGVWEKAGHLQPTFRASLRAKCVEAFVQLYAAENFIGIEEPLHANTIMKAISQLKTPFRRPVGSKLLEYCKKSLGYNYDKENLFSLPGDTDDDSDQPLDQETENAKEQPKKQTTKKKTEKSEK